MFGIICYSHFLSPYIVLEIFVVLTGIFIIRHYIFSVARIVIEEQNMVITLSLHEVILARETIESIKLHRLPIPTILKIKIYGKEKGKKWIFYSYQFFENADIEFLKSSWLNEICTLDGKPLSPDGCIH